MEKSGLTILRPNAFRYFCSLLSNSLLEFVFKVIIFLSHNQLKYCNPDVVKLSLSTIIQDFSKLFKQASLFQYCFHNFIIKLLTKSYHFFLFPTRKLVSNNFYDILNKVFTDFIKINSQFGKFIFLRESISVEYFLGEWKLVCLSK